MKFLPVLPALPVLAAASLALGLVAAAPPHHSAPIVAGDTPGGFRFGSASAPIKLVEFGSLNCSHCAAFAKATDPAIVAAVKSGRMHYEYRPVAIFPQDLATHALAKCVPAGQRLSFIDDYYRSQQGVAARFQAISSDAAAVAAINAVLETGGANAALKLAEVGGMFPIAARHGLPERAARQCIANPATLNWVAASTAAAGKAGVSQTPTFDYNGKRTEVTAVMAKLGVKGE